MARQARTLNGKTRIALVATCAGLLGLGMLLGSALLLALMGHPHLAELLIQIIAGSV